MEEIAEKKLEETAEKELEEKNFGKNAEFVGARWFNGTFDFFWSIFGPGKTVSFYLFNKFAYRF